MPEIHVVFKQVQYFPAAGVRQLYVERDSSRVVFVGHLEYFAKVGSHNYLQVHFMGLFDHDLGKPEVILHYKYHFVAAEDIVAVIACRVDYFICSIGILRL